MMSVEEYALDTNNTVLAIIDMCKKLGINANSSSDMLSEDDIIMYKFLKYYHVPTTIVATKADKLPNSKKAKAKKLILDTLALEVGDNFYTFSSETKEGKENILKELIKGKILYIDNYTGYLGHKEIKGPYGEEEIFIPEYTSNNISLIEIIIDIENKIKNNKKKIRK